MFVPAQYHDDSFTNAMVATQTGSPDALQLTEVEKLRPTHGHVCIPHRNSDRRNGSTPGV
jgi:hypothetical protein